MQELIKTDKTIPFMRFRMVAWVLSGVLLLASIASLAVNQLNWGLDFTGGTVIEVGYEREADLSEIRTTLDANGFSGAVVQNFGTQQDVLIRIEPQEDVKAQEVGDNILSLLRASTDDEVTMRRIEFVGPNVGDQLTEQGGLAMLTALICILVYIAFRFEWRLALGAVGALAHDVILTLGLFSILGLEFDLTVLAALLAVIGYSINDTVVVSDRIRENFRKFRKGTPEEIINGALTITMSRTVITSLTTVLVLLALFFLGGALIHGFATALLFGVFIGTYSSIYIASSLALALGVSREDLMPPEVEKEGEDLDPMP
ncbi:protein translocase subunit SecF [Pseudidiomarina sp. 1APP75-32.1]|uniref:Protein-export membrane protein SecF n=1 Tax=Pseudidiomarina terrestris TaxID=2820060 RepID=A0AAW7QY96_9GAMM|nr:MULTISPECIES: protein translocase subunit SecF [unclassified Pseudidiomarina]MDN7125156.1 protein translocase subunit SecF [Pseudidiomarina sp. 1APP75-32.1]MDN7127441.1 protein translocase subunit SecF [Pseudidiomarina sp. 1APR75-33.1]MDN7129917.1 protein translocase subunit SecF [Pseudidiomarina sp. 1APR75-15]MDN7138392.1 protein translocase subunit SecF [Pseudidiomarina sp. 1ASP75-14]MEA3588978.1 protein translocase subunit SecF [Pseudidiomarina sp. 1APP75-27a]